jgi:hypothetical protein
MGVRVDIKAAAQWFSGENKQLVFPVKDNAGLPVDVAAWTVEWAIMKRTGGAYLLSKETGAGITVEEGPEEIMNLFVVSIDDDEYDTLKTGVELYQELKRIDPGAKATLAYGFVTINKSGIPEPV